MRITVTYRQKLRLKKAGKWFLILLSALAAALVLFLLFVERYVVYTEDGAHIDYGRSTGQLRAETTAPSATTEPLEHVGIIYETPSPNPVSGEPVKGFYLTTADLRNAQNLLSRIESLEYGSTVMLELKDADGYFYYSTNLSGAKTAEDVEVGTVDQIITALRQRGCTLVALIPAFADSEFALGNPSCALPMSDGALWMDEGGFYWLDPANDTVMDYLEQIVLELSSRNFTEVVFEDFYFPTSQDIDYASDTPRAQITAAAAQRVSVYFAGSNLTVSFVTGGTDFPTQGLSGRLYIENADAAQLERFAAAYQSEAWNPQTQLVFLTSSKDSRFDAYSTLSPLP